MSWTLCARADGAVRPCRRRDVLRGVPLRRVLYILSVFLRRTWCLHLRWFSHLWKGGVLLEDSSIPFAAPPGSSHPRFDASSTSLSFSLFCVSGYPLSAFFFVFFVAADVSIDDLFNCLHCHPGPQGSRMSLCLAPETRIPDLCTDGAHAEPVPRGTVRFTLRQTRHASGVAHNGAHDAPGSAQRKAQLAMTTIRPVRMGRCRRQRGRPSCRCHSRQGRR